MLDGCAKYANIARTVGLVRSPAPMFVPITDKQENTTIILQSRNTGANYGCT